MQKTSCPLENDKKNLNYITKKMHFLINQPLPGKNTCNRICACLFALLMHTIVTRDRTYIFN